MKKETKFEIEGELSLVGKAENIIQTFISLLDDVGVDKVELRKDAIKCSIICIDKQLEILKLLHCEQSMDIYEDVNQLRQHILDY